MANKKGAAPKKKGGNGKRGGGVKPATNVNQTALPRSKLLSSSTTASKGQIRTKQAHTQHACSILDPFCTMAKGARRPDGMGSQSLPYQCRSLHNIATTSLGTAKCIILGGQGIYGIINATQNAGTPTTWDYPGTSTQFPGSAYALANGAEIRLVSMGVRIMSTTSATTSQGLVMLGTANNVIYPQTGLAAGIATYAEHSLRPLAAGFESTWISKPTGVAAHDFRAVASITNAMVDFDWTSLVIEVIQGPASANVLMLEIIANVEFTIHMGNTATMGLSQLIPPSKPANPVALAAQAQVHSRVSSIMDTTVEKAGKFIEQKAGSVVEDLLTGAMAFLGL